MVESPRLSSEVASVQLLNIDTDVVRSRSSSELMVLCEGMDLASSVVLALFLVNSMVSCSAKAAFEGFKVAVATDSAGARSTTTVIGKTSARDCR